jgi:hypothetical protein
MSRKLLAVFGLAALAACADSGRDDAAMADSLNRDLQMAPVDTTAMLGDRPADTAATTPAPAWTVASP